MGAQHTTANGIAIQCVCDKCYCKKKQQPIDDGMHHRNSLNRAFNRPIDKDRVELPLWNDVFDKCKKKKEKGARINSLNKRHIQIAMQTYKLVFISLRTEIASIHIAHPDHTQTYSVSARKHFGLWRKRRNSSSKRTTLFSPFGCEQA